MTSRRSRGAAGARQARWSVFADPGLGQAAKAAVFAVLLAVTLAPAPVGAWDESRLTLMPLVLEGTASTTLDDMTRALIEAVAAKELQRGSGRCVVTPKALRAIKRDPKNAPLICGLDASEALGTRHVVHLALKNSVGGWRLTTRYIDRRQSVIMARVDIERVELAALLDLLPDLFAAVAKTAERFPQPESRLIGVVAKTVSTSCFGLGLQAVDAEGTVSWHEPLPFLAKELGRDQLAEAQIKSAVSLARRAAVERAVKGAFTWVLAQQPTGARQIIRDNAVAFDTWARIHVTELAFAEWVKREELLEERLEKTSRQARTMVRACVEVDRLRRAIQKRVALLDPSGKPHLVIISSDPRLAEALVAYGQGFHFPIAGTEIVNHIPDLAFRRAHALIQTSLEKNTAELAILARVAVDAGRAPPVVEIDLRAVDAKIAVVARTTLRAEPRHATADVALSRVTSNWARIAQPQLEAFLLRLAPAQPSP